VAAGFSIVDLQLRGGRLLGGLRCLCSGERAGTCGAPGSSRSRRVIEGGDFLILPVVGKSDWRMAMLCLRTGEKPKINVQ
jgi:hypothetical protein